MIERLLLLVNIVEYNITLRLPNLLKLKYHVFIKTLGFIREGISRELTSYTSSGHLALSVLFDSTAAWQSDNQVALVSRIYLPNGRSRHI